jgi:hypothetical protein
MLAIFVRLASKTPQVTEATWAKFAARDLNSGRNAADIHLS